MGRLERKRLTDQTPSPKRFFCDKLLLAQSSSGFRFGCNPIVALTANAFDQDIDRCIEAGMQAHLAKPLAIEDLRNAVLNWAA